MATPTLLLALPTLGMTEIIIVVVVLLLIFGPKALPSLGRSIGKSLREFKDGVSGAAEQLSQDEEEKKKDEKTPPDEPPPSR